MKGVQACCTHPVAKEIHAENTYNPLLWVLFETVFLKALKDLPQMVCYWGEEEATMMSSM